jgi:hypothetical protein
MATNRLQPENHKRCLTLAKGGEWFVFIYNPEQLPALLEHFAALSRDPESGFDWFDAAALSYQAGQQIASSLE